MAEREGVVVVEIERVDDLQALDRLLAASHATDVWIFKHSLICGVSSAALRPFERFAGEAADGVRFAVIEIQRAREVSAAVADRLGVRHESPQALLVRDGEAVWHASHWAIDLDALRETATRTVGSG